MRKVLTVKWMLVHVLMLIAFGVCLRLGWWQWSRAESHSGTMQNFGYALQWPLFAAFVVVLWWRGIRDVLHPKPASDKAKDEPAAAPRLATPDAPATPAVTMPVLPTDEEDPEVAAYNRYLASLYARDAEREQQRRSRRTAGTRGGNA